MSSFLDKIVVVTGGAGGIGRLLAEKSVQRGASDVIIWDIDQTALSRAGHLPGASGTRVHTHSVDLTDPEQIRAAAERVRTEIGAVDILFNNAGMVAGKKFAEISHAEIQKIINLNVLGAMHTTRAFLPGMIDRGSGHIVNIASASALIGNPRMSVYAGSKWAISGWSESLRLELQADGTSIRVTTVQPGYIKTGMFEGVKPPLMTPLLDPGYITDAIMEATVKNKATVREPFMVKLVPFLRGILPGAVFEFVAGRLFGVYRSMDTFKGKERRDVSHEE